MPSPAQDLKNKLLLEAKLRPKIKAYNEKLIREFARQYKFDGNILNVSRFNNDLNAILADHYKETSDIFDNNLGPDLPEDVEPTEQERQDIEAALATYFLLQSKERSAGINNSTQNDFDQSIVDASQDEMAQDLIGRERIIVIATLAAVFAGRKLNGRTESIVQTEGQFAAETSKATEAEILSGREPSILAPTPTPAEIEKEWISVGDSLVREAHLAADGQKKKISEPFVVGGELLRWPGDTSLGASLGNIINCLHPDSIVDAENVKALSRRYYQGAMIRIKMSSSDDLAVTPNHPILTTSGWVLAKFIDHRHSIIGCHSSKGTEKCFNVENIKTTIEQEFDSLLIGRHIVRIPGIVVNFHGEIPNHDVDVINADGFLWNIGKTKLSDVIRKEFFPATDFGTGHFFSDCLLNGCLIKKLRSFCTDSFMCIFSKTHSFVWGSKRHSMKHGLRTIPWFNASMLKGFLDSASIISGFFVDLFYRKSCFMIRQYISEYFIKFGFVPGSCGFGWRSHAATFSDNDLTLVERDIKSLRTVDDTSAGKIVINDVLLISHFNYSGYVYNLETESNIYLSQGVINHNCRCSADYNQENITESRRS